MGTAVTMKPAAAVSMRACPPGTWIDRPKFDDDDWKLDPLALVSNIKATMRCKKCPAGRFGTAVNLNLNGSLADAEGWKACTKCPAEGLRASREHRMRGVQIWTPRSNKWPGALRHLLKRHFTDGDIGRNEWEACPAGTFGGGKGNCIECPSGRFSDGKIFDCQYCLMGYSQPLREKQNAKHVVLDS